MSTGCGRSGATRRPPPDLLYTPIDKTSRHALAVILVFSTIPLLAFATWRQVRIWQDGVTLWRHAVRLDPASPIAAANLGWELRARGDLAEAVEQCQRALLLRPD